MTSLLRVRASDHGEKLNERALARPLGRTRTKNSFPLCARGMISIGSYFEYTSNSEPPTIYFPYKFSRVLMKKKMEDLSISPFSKYLCKLYNNKIARNPSYRRTNKIDSSGRFR